MDRLDDRQYMAGIDREDMLSSIMELPEQLAIGMGGNRVDIPYFRPENIVAAGMGGSAIAGEIAAAWLCERLSMPFVTSRNYNLPSFVSGKTLVLALSYSGNTYETLNMVEEALERKATVVAISSGGKLMEMAEEHGLSMIELPSGLQPRSAMGYLVAAIGSVMKSLNLYDPDVELLSLSALLRDLRERINPSVPTEKNEAKRIAMAIEGSIPVIYSYGPYVAAANRWHTQINENAKLLSFYGALTEMDRNEIVGWNSDAKGFSAVFLRGNEGNRLKEVTDFNEEVIERAGGTVVDVGAEGNNTLEKMMSLIYMGDFVSYYLAILRETDPTPEDVISELETRISDKL